MNLHRCLLAGSAGLALLGALAAADRAAADTQGSSSSSSSSGASPGPGGTSGSTAPASSTDPASTTPAPAADPPSTDPGSTPSPTPSSSSPSSPSAGLGSVTRMEQMQVTGVPIEDQILPTSRPFSSVFGTDDDILDVPRNVTIISSDQLDAVDIQDVTQFSKLTSSSYTDSNFGSPANPTIRGQSADVFINGQRQRIGESGDGMPFDFNIVESVNIVPGPATAVQGASAYVGGFVDMITKQPFFDGSRGSVTYTAGSNDTNRATLDVGGPLSPTLAYRFSYTGEDSDQYWYNSIKQTTSVYGAISWRPNDIYDLTIDAHAFWADYRENFGINRPTQLLISDGLYQSGTNIDNGTHATPSDPQNALNVTSDDTIAFGPVVPVDYREVAQGPASHAHGQEYNVQAIQTAKVSPNFVIKDSTIWSLTQRDTYNSDGYSEIIHPAVFTDNRTELIFSGDWGDVNTGVEEYVQHVVAYDNFFFEPVNVWDLSNANDRWDINFQNSQYFLTNSGALPVPGWPGRYATQGIYNDDTNDSTMYKASPFVQTEIKLGGGFILVSGARMDFMRVDDQDPLTPNTETQIGVGEPNANLSLVDRITSSVSTYATVNFSENYTGDLGDGGGFGLYLNDAGIAELPRSLFSEESKLFEYGVKTSTDNNELFLSSDVFFQTRQNKPQGSPVIQYQYYGFEVLANYQPNKNFYATCGYSWINGSLPSSSDPFQAYDTQQIPNGPPDPFTDAAAYPTNIGRLRAPGQPLDLINGLLSYTWDNGFGVESNIVVTSPMNNDYWGYLVIPWQYELDGGVSYKFGGHWKVRLDCTNITDRHNWEPSDATYALEGIVPEPAFQTFGSVRYSF